MPKKASELSPLAVKRLTSPGMHAVGGVGGLYLQVTASGARSWILRAMVGGKRRDLGLGGFPDVSLAQARERAQADRDLIRQGVDPAEQRKRARLDLITAQAKSMTFAEAARQCHAKRSHEFRNAKHRAQWWATLETYALPMIGQLPVADIELAHVLRVLEPIWHTKTETATRLRQRMEAVLSWATVSGFRSGDNPARWAGNLKEVLPTPSKIATTKHHRALPWQDVPAFMAALRDRQGMAARALEFAILTGARSGEVRGARWDEIDLDARLWTIPGERMKAGRTHRVPLTPDAVAMLEALPRMEGCAFVFPAPRGGQLSDMALAAVTRRMGADCVPHGFRSSFKDWARSSTRFADEVSELALAHISTDATRAAYARDGLMPQRAKLMAAWATYLGAQPVANSKVTPMRVAG
ncbi:MAG: integrase arm-type DNA-binding domain-containing protein [Pseudomonadota bacterium]|nr:integrase arm-type DNA-binding domain-containing protein [Pseudomonadota bacterium]